MLTCHMLHIQRKFDLHVGLVRSIRAKYPDAVVLQRFAEFQGKRDVRIKVCQQGYTSGHPDLTLLHPSDNTHYFGLAIEFKHTSCKMTAPENQDKSLNASQGNGVKQEPWCQLYGRRL